MGTPNLLTPDRKPRLNADFVDDLPSNLETDKCVMCNRTVKIKECKVYRKFWKRQEIPLCSVHQNVLFTLGEEEILGLMKMSMKKHSHA